MDKNFNIAAGILINKMISKEEQEFRKWYAERIDFSLSPEEDRRLYQKLRSLYYTKLKE